MKSNIFYFVLMHIGFLIYSGYALVGKIASKQTFLSANFIILYGIVFFIMFLYATIWQQILKKIKLSTAIANKSITIIWGVVFGKLFFVEEIKLNMIFGIILILSGILILNSEKENQNG